MHPYLRRFSWSLPKSFAALCGIFFFGFFTYYIIGNLFVWGSGLNSTAETVSNIILMGAMLTSIVIASLAVSRAINERPMGKAIIDGAIWTAGLFLAFILLTGIASVGAFQLTEPHPDSQTVELFRDLLTSYQGKVFGCKEELLFGLTPWFCGDLPRSLADGAIVGAFFFGISKAIHQNLPEKTGTAGSTPVKKLKKRKTKRKNRRKG